MLIREFCRLHPCSYCLLRHAARSRHNDGAVVCRLGGGPFAAAKTASRCGHWEPKMTMFDMRRFVKWKIEIHHVLHTALTKQYKNKKTHKMMENMYSFWLLSSCVFITLHQCMCENCCQKLQENHSLKLHKSQGKSETKTNIRSYKDSQT